ncbi:hypothetical protein [Nitrosospira multiformis]|uniref:hypothetical protein n=1 Tax=Nitrosospira multiformis TaxID=1231 RepID=UPI0008999FA2|nr:hypothetical protein [Nitrosospira multiformis]SDZ92950.1 hypothetical protein SAMN05216411_1037 [Nitrosospira multiformis]
MEITLYHSLKYTTKGTVPVPIVADSLLANESLIYESLRFLEYLHKELQISSIRVSVSKLSNESPLHESMAATLLISLQDDLIDEVPQIIEK